jgi:hypothetical protein
VRRASLRSKPRSHADASASSRLSRSIKSSVNLARVRIGNVSAAPFEAQGRKGGGGGGGGEKHCPGFCRADSRKTTTNRRTLTGSAMCQKVAPVATAFWMASQPTGARNFISAATWAAWRPAIS